MMLPGSATLRVCVRGLVGLNVAVGLDVSRFAGLEDDAYVP